MILFSIRFGGIKQTSQYIQTFISFFFFCFFFVVVVVVVVVFFTFVCLFVFFFFHLVCPRGLHLTDFYFSCIFKFRLVYNLALFTTIEVLCTYGGISTLAMTFDPLGLATEVLKDHKTPQI